MLRKNQLSFLVLAAVLLLPFVLTGCGKKTLAEVNGDAITRDEFYARLERVPVQSPQGLKLASDYVMEQLINERLIKQFAEKKGVTPTDKEIEEKLEEIKKQSAGKLDAILKQRGMTIDDLKNEIKVQRSFVNIVTKGIEITEEETKAAYDQALTAPNSPFKRPEQVLISAIETQTKEKIDEAYKELKNGTAFDVVAKKFSEDETTRERGGRVNWISKNMPNLPDIIKQKAFALSAGSFSEPFMEGTKWYIIRADQKRPAKTSTFEEVKSSIKEQMAMQKGAANENFRNELKKFIEESKIEAKSERFKTVAETIKKDAAKNLQMPGAGKEANGNKQ
ncbi:MAG: peptidyl-prolyl cis-trans isomerase [Armatimonadota bacterium]